MMEIETISNWLKSTWLNDWATNIAWVWPVSQILHFFGLVMLLGMTLLLDLRLLGVCKGLKPRGIHQMMKLGVVGFGLNILSGLVFLAGDPDHFLGNPAFQWKMGFIALAGVNVLIFYSSGLGKRVDAMEAGEAAPFGARVVAAVSLFSWAAVMYCGRMLPYLGNSF